MAELTPEQEEYRRKQKERMNSLIVGAKDRVGSIISHVYARGDEYIVYDYENEDGSKVLRVFLDTEIEDDPKNMLGNLNKIKLKRILVIAFLGSPKTKKINKRGFRDDPPQGLH